MTGVRHLWCYNLHDTNFDQYIVLQHTTNSEKLRYRKRTVRRSCDNILFNGMR